MHACPHSAVKGPDSNAKRRHLFLRALLPHLSKLISKMLSKYFSLSHQCGFPLGAHAFIPIEIGRLSTSASVGFKDSSTIIPAPPGRRRCVLHDNYPIESIQGNPPNAAMCYQSSLSIQTETFLSVYLLATHLIFFLHAEDPHCELTSHERSRLLISRLISYSCVHGGVRKVVTFRTWPFPDE